MRKLLFAASLFLGSTVIVSCESSSEPSNASVPTQSQETNPYQAFLTEAFANGEFNGNVQVVQKGETVYQGSFGVRNQETGDKLDENSVFRLASVSKQFTAMAVMILKEEGKLDYDQDIREILPELPYEGVTIRHLLNHTAGLPDYVAVLNDHWKPELEAEDPARLIEGNDDILPLLAEHAPSLTITPGERMEYSNTGYVLLASIVERISKMPFEDFLQTQIFEPVGMSNTSVYDWKPGEDAALPNRVFGFTYDTDGTTIISTDNHYLNGAKGDGGIYATTADLALWDRALYTSKLVPQSTLQEAYTPAVLNDGNTSHYGFGWIIDPQEDGHVYHTGGWAGFMSLIDRDMKNETCIIFTSNHAPGFGGIVDGLRNISQGRDASLPPANYVQSEAN